MTNITPQQMRELQALSGGILNRNLLHGSGVWKINRDVTEALGAAADQLEAVRVRVESLRMPLATGQRLRAIHHNAAIDAVLAILTADESTNE